MNVRSSTGRRVVASAMAGLAILGLCSCSRDSAVADPTGGPTAPVEQTIAPSEAAVDISDPATVPADAWASDSPDYVFSDTPQGVQEQWLAQNWPELWAQGVRAVTTDTWVEPNIFPAAAGDKGTPGPLVEFVGGVRYDGTADMPLRFQPGVRDGSTLSSVNIDANIAIARNPSSSAVGIDFGRSSYSVGIIVHDIAAADGADKGMQDYPTTVKISCDGFSVIGSPREFKTKDEAIAYVMGGVTPNGVADARVINPGEIASINLIDRVSNTETHFSTFDPRTGGWISTD